MTSELHFRVVSWAGWCPDSDALKMGGEATARGTLPIILRRRVSPIGRKLLEAAWAVFPDGGMTPRMVLSSRHGEYSRTFSVLTELAQSGEVSPAEFSLSVHHALAGLLSIACGDTAGHTAIAAGPESFAYALLEAAACLADKAEPVLLMHFDEALPEIYTEIDGAAEDPVALAFLLYPQNSSKGYPIRQSMWPAVQAAADPLALRFIELLENRTKEVTGTGPRMNWRWCRAAA